MKWANSKIEVFIFVVLFFFLLHILASLLVPLAFAFLLAALFQPIILYMKNHKIPGWVIYPLTIIFSLGIIFLIILAFSNTISQFLQQQDYFIARLGSKFTSLLEWIKAVSLTYFNTEFTADLILKKILESEILSSGISGFINMIGNFASSFLIFAFYYIVFLISMSEYRSFLGYVSGDKNSARLIKNYEAIQNSIFTYVKVKIFVSFIDGLFVYIILIIFSCPYKYGLDLSSQPLS